MSNNNNYSPTEEKDTKIITNISRINNDNDSYNFFNNIDYPINNNYNKGNDINFTNISNDTSLNSNINAPLKYKKYNFHEIRKELNNKEKNDFNNFYENNNNNNTNNHNQNLLRFNSYRDIHYNSDFHSNINNEIEKNKLKLENEKLTKENMSIKKELNDALNTINRIKDQPLLLNNNNNNEFNKQLSILQNKISIYELSLEETKNKYETEINYYIQQLSNYTILISIVNSFFQNIFKNYMHNYNYSLNIPNNLQKNTYATPLNRDEFEEKFKIIEKYIFNLNNELKNYKIKNKTFESSLLNPNLIDNKDDININIKDDEFKLNNNNEEDNQDNEWNNNNSFIKTNDFFSKNNKLVFENEIIAKKLRSNSSTKAKCKYINKENKKNNSFAKNKKNKKGKNSKRKDSRNNLNKNNNIDIIKSSKKNNNNKTFKKSIDIPNKDKNRSKSKNKIKNKY